MEADTKKLLFAVLVIAIAFVYANGITGKVHDTDKIAADNLKLRQDFCGFKGETRCDFSGIYYGIEPNQEGSVVYCNGYGELQFIKACPKATKCVWTRSNGADCLPQYVSQEEYKQ